MVRTQNSIEPAQAQLADFVRWKTAAHFLTGAERREWMAMGVAGTKAILTSREWGNSYCGYYHGYYYSGNKQMLE